MGLENVNFHHAFSETLYTLIRKQRYSFYVEVILIVLIKLLYFLRFYTKFSIDEVVSILFSRRFMSEWFLYETTASLTTLSQLFHTKEHLTE
jgi:hypothetical protein